MLSKYLYTFTLPAGRRGSILIYRLIIVSGSASLGKKHDKSSQTSCLFAAAPSPCFFNLQSLSDQDLKIFYYIHNPGYWPSVLKLVWQHASFPDMFTSSFRGWNSVFGLCTVQNWNILLLICQKGDILIWNFRWHVCFVLSYFYFAYIITADCTHLCPLTPSLRIISEIIVCQ